MTSPESANPPRRPARIGFEGLLRLLLRYRSEARGYEQLRENELDRQHLLFRAGQELGLSERGLLERGFDKAYRRMVEGI